MAVLGVAFLPTTQRSLFGDDMVAISTSSSVSVSSSQNAGTSKLPGVRSSKAPYKEGAVVTSVNQGTGRRGRVLEATNGKPEFHRKVAALAKLAVEKRKFDTSAAKGAVAGALPGIIGSWIGSGYAEGIHEKARATLDKSLLAAHDRQRSTYSRVGRAAGAATGIAIGAGLGGSTGFLKKKPMKKEASDNKYLKMARSLI